MIPNRKAVIEMTIGLVVMAGSVQADPTVITTCPFVINSPGRYVLRADLICGGPGITILSSDVTLALEGHRITAGVGAKFSAAIRVPLLHPPPFGPLTNVHILGPGLITNGGENTFSSGVSLTVVNNSEVSGVTVLGSSGAGIDAGPESIAGGTCDFLTITKNTLGRNNTGIRLLDVRFSTISENDASGNIGTPSPPFFGLGSGMWADRSFGTTFSLGTVSHNTFNGNTNGGLLISGNQTATIQNNVTNGNGGNGISLLTGVFPPGPSSAVTNNTSLANGIFDLFDLTQGCSPNVWSGNTFFTANQSCIH
jgi:parallel beta-helix repeat protein